MSGCFESGTCPFGDYAASVASFDVNSKTISAYAFSSSILEHFNQLYRENALPKQYSFKQVIVTTRGGKLEAVSLEKSADEMLSTPNSFGFAMRESFHFIAVLLLSLLGFKLDWPLTIIDYRNCEREIKVFLNEFFDKLPSLSDDARTQGQYLVHAISQLLIVCRNMTGVEQLLKMRSHHDFLLSQRPQFLEVVPESPVTFPLRDLMIDVSLAAAKVPDDARSINSGGSPRSLVGSESGRKSCCTCWFGASKEDDDDPLKEHLVASSVETYGSTSPNR